MRLIHRHALTGAWVLGLLLASSQVAQGTFYLQSVTNNTGATANDISVTWPQGVGPVQVQDPSKTKFPATAQNQPPRTWLVNQGQGMSVPAGGVGNVSWQYNFNPPVAISGGNWTNNGANIGAITPGRGGNVIGAPVKISKDDFNKKLTFNFTNPESFPVNYASVNIWVDNSMANFDINNFDTPTGTQVESNGSFTLGPAGGGSDTLALTFSYLSSSSYGLVTAVVSDPPSGTSSSLETADVPEPAALGLFTLIATILARPKRRA